MGTVQLQHADGAGPVAKRDKVLAQYPDPQRQVAQIVGEAHRLPEPAQVFAARRVGADMGEFDVLARVLTMVVTGETRPQERLSSDSHGKPPCWCSTRARDRVGARRQEEFRACDAQLAGPAWVPAFNA